MFPLLLLLRRRLGAAATLVLATLPAVAVGLFGPAVSAVDKLSGLAPQLAPLFAFGLVGAGIVAARDRVRRLPWPGLAALAAAPVLAVIAGTGTVWTVRHYVWIDLAIGPAMTLLLVAVTTGRPEALVRLLDTRPVRGLGRFSYSLYLVHLLIVVVVSRTLSRYELVGPGLPRFFATVAWPCRWRCSWPASSPPSSRSRSSSTAGGPGTGACPGGTGRAPGPAGGGPGAGPGRAPVRSPGTGPRRPAGSAEAQHLRDVGAVGGPLGVERGEHDDGGVRRGRSR